MVSWPACAPAGTETAVELPAKWREPSASGRTAFRVRPVIRPRLKRLVEGCTVRSFPLVVITAPQVGASCLGISLGPPPARVIARRARLRSSSGQIFAARASVEGQRRVYAPGVTRLLSYARRTA